MRRCNLCKREKEFLSKTLEVCLDCIREKPNEAISFIRKTHEEVRREYNLPISPPKDEDGIQCNICANSCRIGGGGKGYCGLRENQNGKLVSKVSEDVGLLHYYLDPIPTNCCASWFCGAKGRYNLAVFFYGCGFNCLFCQNYSHKLIGEASQVGIDEFLQRALDPQVHCVCFFGGSPEPQLPFVINFSKKILEIAPKRICLEWNGIGNENLVREISGYVMKSKGIIKFDLKAFNEDLSFALSGVSNRKALENFNMIAEEFLPKAGYPMLTATTLLVPGYVDKIEVKHIAGFIAKLNPEIPYSLLAFYPNFYMSDLPVTPRDWAFDCLDEAKKYLKNLNLGNKYLLGL